MPIRNFSIKGNKKLSFITVLFPVWIVFPFFASSFKFYASSF